MLHWYMLDLLSYSPAKQNSV